MNKKGGFATAPRGLSLPGATPNEASTPNSAALAITGDISIRSVIRPAVWPPATDVYSIIKEVPSNQRSYGHGFTVAGDLVMRFSIDGTTALQLGAAAPFVLTPGKAYAFRTDRIASSGLIRYYTGPAAGKGQGPWTLYATNPGGPTGALFVSTAPLEIGARAVNNNPFNGDVVYAEIRNGLDGPPVAIFDPSSIQANSRRSPAAWRAGTGELWTAAGAGWSWALPVSPTVRAA